MAFKAGTKTGNTNEYAGSMAAAMENAFLREWPAIMGSAAPQPDNQIRLLFIAIAQGVLRHLKDNEDSISVNVPTYGVIDADIATEGTLY